MEYLPGGSLNDYVNKRDGLPEREAIKCIRQIGSALLYLHTNKMLHLDVKPANIMRSDTTGALKLIDFGLAKRYVDNGDPESSASLGSGTTGYAPLEQADASNEMEFSPSIDVYALGATYYKLLTAHVPDSAVDVLNSGLSTMPLVKKNVSQKSIDAIKAAMEPLKAKRLPNVQEFLDMLPRVDDDTIFYEKKERKLKKRWLVAVLLTVLILLPSAYFLFFVKRKNTPLQVAAFEKALNMEMVRVEGGTFMMGCDSVSDTMADSDERPLRKVALSTFYIGRYEVTLRQWDAVMRHTADGSSKNADFPVHNITWDDVERFIDRLNEETGREYRLPTEAEWEYAARGGRHAEKYAYSGGKQPGPVAWFAENSNRTVHRVGGLQPNALGLYDMSGNVWELCSDYYGPYDTLDVKDPQGPEQGVYHVMRGGSCNSSPQSCRVTFRQDNSLMSGDAVVGFRLVLPAEDR